MKILRVISSMHPASGGPCQGIRNSIPELDKIGVYNEVLCLNDPQETFIAKDPFKIHALGQAKGPWAYHKELFPWLLEYLTSYDSVIIHGLWQYHGYAVRKAIKHLKREKPSLKLPKVFVMPHGMLDPYFQKAAGRKLKALRNVLYWKFLESGIVNNADGVLFTCEAELLLAREPFKPYWPKKEFNIGYGIQAPPVYNDRMNEAFTKLCPVVKEKPYLLFLSRIHDKKGVDLLIKAYLGLQNQGMDLPHLVIAGPGLETDYGKQMQELANQSKTIHFPGMLTGDAKWGAFYGCKAFVLPSHQENFGIAVVEALACAKPVLISNQVNIWKEIAQENAGLVASDDENGTIDLLNRWLGMDDSERKTMSEQASKIYQKYYDVKQAALRMKEVLGKN